MTQPTEQPNEAVEAPEGNTEAIQESAPVDVEALQQQATEAREQLDEATSRGDAYFEVLKLRTLEAAAGDLVQALDHMPADDPRYFDDAGFPSLDGMREVATELVAARPYLAKATGNVHQGVKDTPAEVTWSDVLRGVFG